MTDEKFTANSDDDFDTFGFRFNEIERESFHWRENGLKPKF